MDSNVKVSIGLNPDMPEDPKVYTRVNFDFQIQAERIKMITKQLQAKLGKQQLPTLIFDFPESAKNVTIKLFEMDQRDGHSYEVINKDGRVYRCINIQVPEFVNTKKKIEKVFSKLTELDNKLYLHIDIYNMDQLREKLKAKQDYAMVVFLQKIKMEGRFLLDPKFFELLTELISKISPKFAESPIMAILPLFGGIDCELQLDSLNQLEPSNQEQLFAMKSYEDPADNEHESVIQGFNNKDKVYIYLSFGSMGIFKIEVEVRMFVFYNCLT